MSVRILPPTEANIAFAAERLFDGGLVAFPTETVYGLGANALNENAVAGIFTAKGRPPTNPLIVHAAATEHVRTLCVWNATAQRLAEKFWPGALTLILPKGDSIPALVTAGSHTVGVRVPNHPVALQLLQCAVVPVAAPSANRSEAISPTTAQHVADSLGPFLDDLNLIILDGGPCAVGLESTVLDLTTNPPRILRPGMVTARMLEVLLGYPVAEGAEENATAARSPGQMPRHYAPRKPLVVVRSDVLPRVMQAGDGLVELLRDPEEYARRLYLRLHELDASPLVQRILVVEPPHTPPWAAIHDRLRRAAAPKESG